jgi:hypothetical protein
MVPVRLRGSLIRAHSYVALFCAAFPLAPLAAMISNAFEVRSAARRRLDVSLRLVFKPRKLVGPAGRGQVLDVAAPAGRGR